MSREAMQMALDMLNEIADDVYCDQKLEGVITALRQALGTEQEPVVWLKTWSDGSVSVLKSKSGAFADHELEPLYAAPQKRDLTCVCGAVWDGEMMVHPPKKREWVGLTDEEIQDLSYLSQKIDASNAAWFDRCGFARAVEQALKEKNT